MKTTLTSLLQAADLVLLQSEVASITHLSDGRVHITSYAHDEGFGYEATVDNQECDIDKDSHVFVDDVDGNPAQLTFYIRMPDYIVTGVAG